MPKRYLGDGVYAEWDGYHITLTTENGISTTNTIYLDPNVQVSLAKMMEQIVSSGGQG
jgi:hypothetical protein